MQGLKRQECNIMSQFYFRFLSSFLGCGPKESKGTLIRVPVNRDREFARDVWLAKFTQRQNDGETVTRVQITPPANAIVGRYDFFVETKTEASDSEKPEIFRYKHPEEIIVLFNPWCRGKY